MYSSEELIARPLDFGSDRRDWRITHANNAGALRVIALRTPPLEKVLDNFGPP
jgi:hypothetical protein